jgi:ComF family protein
MSVRAATLATAARAARAGVAALARPLVAFAFPQRCPGCGVPADAARLLCEACLAAIPTVPETLCAACLAAERTPVDCVRHPAQRVWVAWVYDDACAALLHAFKFEGRTALAELLGARLAAALPAAWRPELVTGVPLHAARRRERGYDQAEMLARVVADAIGVPYVPLLRRVRPTRAQSSLGPVARRRNPAGAFAVTQPSWADARRVLVIDDVVTTGATLDACTRALVAAGARPAAAAVAWAG